MDTLKNVLSLMGKQKRLRAELASESDPRRREQVAEDLDITDICLDYEVDQLTRELAAEKAAKGAA